VHPVTAPPIEDGAVLVDANGRIAAVGPHARVPAPSDAQDLHFPDGNLVPGLVNCHTHLELTHLGGGARHDEPEFITWIRRIRELKDKTGAADFYDAAVAGIRDCWARGVTCFAETGSTGAVMRALHALGGRGIVYQEVFGPDPAKLDVSMKELTSAVEGLRALVSPERRLGISPHAPYTVSAALYEAVNRYARRERLPLAVHIAESADEWSLVCRGDGAFAQALRARGIGVTPHKCSPIAYLLQHGVLRRGTLCIHCVHVNEADIELLRVTGATVAHCPRSNAAHRHGLAPLRAMIKAGVPVGLGTDSVISVGELDLWAEAQMAGFVGPDALRMLTIEGARALGWESEIGSLAVGKAADIAVFSSAAVRRPSPPLAALTVVSGRIVHQISGS
jgi:5-methylthioadenosine/S-adenosylhomocysteine deaminase